MHMQHLLIIQYITENNIYKNIKFDAKKAGFIRPASTFSIIQLSNSRVGGDSDALLTKCSLQHKINMN